MGEVGLTVSSMQHAGLACEINIIIDVFTLAITQSSFEASASRPGSTSVGMIGSPEGAPDTGQPAEPSAATKFENRCYDDADSLLFGLRGASWTGPACEDGNYASSLSELIGAFHAAQKRSSARQEVPAWAFNKALRKEHWCALAAQRPN